MNGMSERRGSALAHLLNTVCSLYSVTTDELRSTSRTNNLSRARWALIYVLREDWGWDYPRIGKLISKSHVAALLGHSNASALLTHDGNFYQSIVEIREALDDRPL